MHAKKYWDRCSTSEIVHSFFNIGVFLIRSRHFRARSWHDLRSVVTVEVTSRFRTDFACLMFNILPICTPKIMQIHPVVTKIITRLARLGSVVFVMIRSRHFRAISSHDLRSVVTLEVNGRFRPDFACLISHFVSLCTAKVIEIAAVNPK
jgi:hypothetical protein